MKDPQEMTFFEKVKAVSKEDCPRELRLAWYTALLLYLAVIVVTFMVV